MSKSINQGRHWRRLVSVFAVVGLIGVTAACGDDDDAVSSTPPPAEDDGGASAEEAGQADAVERPSEYVIGSILPLSGPASRTGEAIAKGEEVFWDQHQEIDGVPVRIVQCDDGTAPDKAAACARRLIEQEEAHVIMGPHISSPAKGAAPILANGPISINLSPYVHPSPDVPIFQAIGDSTDIHRATLRFLSETLGWERIGVVATTDETGQIAVEEQEEFADEFGLTLKTERMDVTDTDATAQIAALRDFDPDGIVLWMAGGPTAANFQALKQLRMDDMPVFMHSISHVWGFFEQVGPIVPDELYTTAPDTAIPEEIEDEALRQEIEAFHQAYEEEYGSRPDVAMMYALDTWKLTLEVLQETGGDKEAAIEYLEGLKDHRLLNVEVTYSEDSHRNLETDVYHGYRVHKDGTLESM